VGYCLDLFPRGGVCHGTTEEEAYHQLCALVAEEVEKLRREGRELPPASARPMQGAFSALAELEAENANLTAAFRGLEPTDIAGNQSLAGRTGVGRDRGRVVAQVFQTCCVAEFQVGGPWKVPGVGRFGNLRHSAARLAPQLKRFGVR
jgi:hypothetical protein